MLFQLFSYTPIRLIKSTLSSVRSEVEGVNRHPNRFPPEFTDNILLSSAFQALSMILLCEVLQLPDLSHRLPFFFRLCSSPEKNKGSPSYCRSSIFAAYKLWTKPRLYVWPLLPNPTQTNVFLHCAHHKRWLTQMSSRSLQRPLLHYTLDGKESYLPLPKG